MDRGDSFEVGGRICRVLGDVTNSYGKRGLPLLPGKFVIGNEASRKGENLEAGVEGASSGKRVCKRVENLNKGTDEAGCRPKICENMENNRKYFSLFSNSEDGKGKNLSSHKVAKNCGSVVSSEGHQPVQANLVLNASPFLNGTKENSSLWTCRPQHVMNNSPFNKTTDAKKLMCNFVASDSVPLQADKTAYSSLIIGSHHGHYGTGGGETVRDAIHIDAVDWDRCELKLKCFSPPMNNSVEAVALKGNRMDNSECLTNEPSEISHAEAISKPSGPLVSKVLDLEEFENLQSTFLDNHGLNVEEVSDSTKACSCPLCLKAAYMWTDLLYQDAKGRFTEIMKSTEEARHLVARSYSNDWITTSTVEENPEKVRRSEFDFMQRWRLLFLHTESALLRENAQLQSNLLRLKELRENCRSELGKMSRVPSSRS